MKNPTVWAGIIGALLVALNFIGFIYRITNQSEVLLLNVAELVSSALWVFFGVFLVILFFKERHKQDKQAVKQKPEPGSPDDLRHLSIQRNWIFAILLITIFISSTQIWILNDYSAGFTSINLSVICDLIFNILFLFFAIQLIRGKNVLNYLFYLTVAYSAIEIGLSIWRDDVYAAFLFAIWGSYFAYAIKMPLNRANHRIAHLLLLPLFAVLSFALPFLETGNIQTLIKENQLLVQQFDSDTARGSTAYGLFTQRGVPIASDMDDLTRALSEREARITAIRANLDALEAEYLSLIPTVPYRRSIERIKMDRELYAMHEKQAAVIEEFVEYVRGINFFWLTEEQTNKMAEFRSKVDELNLQIGDYQFKIKHSNLGQ